MTENRREIEASSSTADGDSAGTARAKQPANIGDAACAPDVESRVSGRAKQGADAVCSGPKSPDGHHERRENGHCRWCGRYVRGAPADNAKHLVHARAEHQPAAILREL